MLNDHERNEFYRHAINDLIGKERARNAINAHGM
jgi:hypothetical protein